MRLRTSPLTPSPLRIGWGERDSTLGVIPKVALLRRLPWAIIFLPFQGGTWFGRLETPKKRHPAMAWRRAGDAITGGVMSRTYQEMNHRQAKSGRITRENGVLTKLGKLWFITGTSLLSVSTAGRGAAFTEAALAFFRGQMPVREANA